MLVASVHASDVDLLPFNGNIVGLEDLLDALGDLGTDTVTGDEGDSVLAAELGGLEDVVRDSRERAGGRRGGAQEGLLEGRALLALLSWRRQAGAAAWSGVGTCAVR